MKAEDIYNKALAEYPIKEKLNEKAVGTYDANHPRRKAFIAGAEWMQERMVENPDGGALLYAVEKTAERTKREVIEKAVEWLKGEMCYRDQSSGRGSYGEVKTLGGYDSLEEFIDEFKKAMQDERKDI